MVIVNFESRECSQSFSNDSRVNRIRKRRNPGIQVSALDRVLRNVDATSTQIEITNLPDFQYSHLYKRTKHFLGASYHRLKQFGRYLTGIDGYCDHCRDYRQFIAENERVDAPKSSDAFGTRTRFSDSFVQKVQSQQQHQQSSYSKSESATQRIKDTEMPCCTSCKRPRSSLEIFCGCEDPPRRVVTGPYRYSRCPPSRYWMIPKKKRQRKWWCCGKKSRDNWEECCYCHQKIKRKARFNAPIPPPFMYPSCSPCHPYPPCNCPQNLSMKQRFKKYMNIRPTGFPPDVDMYTAYMDGLNFDSGRPSCCAHNWNGYNMSRVEREPDSEVFDDMPPPRRHRSCSHMRRPSYEEFPAPEKEYHSEEEYVDEPGSDSDDCCCCCPCRKNFHSANAQTELQERVVPKTQNTQTDRCCAKKRCCRCCRNACGLCNRHPYHVGVTGAVQSKPGKSNINRTKKTEKRPPFCSRGRNECKSHSPGHSGRNSPTRSNNHKDNEARNNKAKTIICKQACVQHGPTDSGITLFASPRSGVLDHHSCQCGGMPSRKMQSVMFNTIQPTPLFLDKMFTPINHMSNIKNYSLTNNPLKMNLSSTPFLSTFYQGNEDFSDQSITARSKKRFMNAVCDSILADLTSKRRNSFSNLLKSPDSGYQEPKPKKSFFSLKTRSSSHKNVKNTGRKQSKTKFSMDHMIKTLKGDKMEEKDSKPAKNVMGEASKVVRNILEEISTKKEETNYSDSSKHEILNADSFRNILLSMKNYGNCDINESCHCDLEQSRSDSVLLDFEALPGTSTASACVGPTAILSPRDESYMKLMKTLDTVRNKNKR